MYMLLQLRIECTVNLAHSARAERGQDLVRA